MGCTQSKIEDEETVRRCKERKQHMERAVTARNKFAAAHSAYAMSLKNTGAALSDYAHGEVQFPSATSVVSAPVTGGASVTPLPPPIPPYDSFPLPPPPLPPSVTSSPLQRAATMPEFSIPRPDGKIPEPAIEEENEDDIENESVHNLKHRSSKSSGGSVGGRTGVTNREVEEEELQQPPTPPLESDRSREKPAPAPPMPENKGMSHWDFFFSTENLPGPTLAEVDENREEREEMERKMLEERARRSQVDDGDGGSMRSGGMRSGKPEVAEVVENAAELPPQPPLPQAAAVPAAAAVTKVAKRSKQGAPAGGKKKGPSNVNLVQVFAELDDCFLKASESAYDVSRMLEATRLHYHSNFADKRGHINHSERVMRVITWNRSFKGLQNTDDGVDDLDSEEHETHATVLDKMLAWEKKLYDEVKAGEQMKLEYQRKVASLSKLKKRGSNTEALERMKAAVSHLHTRYIVDMQSMDSTVSEINRLRDEQLYPKLVTLVDGMAMMWETMRVYHGNQSKIVQRLRYLDINELAKETSDNHHERTIQLWRVVEEWHSQLSEFMIQQKEYIKALNSWLKLNLIPIDTSLKEKVSSPGRPQNPPIQILLDAWHDYLGKIPDEPARAAISNFAAIVNTIIQYQKDELNFREKCAALRKDLIRKTRKFEDWYNKFMQKRTPPDEMDPDRAHDKELIAEQELLVEMAKKILEEEEESYRKQCIQVREKSLTNLKNHLPVLFSMLSDFSLACSDMYSNLRNITKSQRRA